METRISLPAIADSEKTPLVLLLLEIIEKLFIEVRDLKDEVARLKGLPARPSLRPSNTSKLDKIAISRSENSKKKRKTSRRRR